MRERSGVLGRVVGEWSGGVAAAAEGCVGLPCFWLGGVFDSVVVLGGLFVVGLEHLLVFLSLGRVDFNFEIVDWLFAWLGSRCSVLLAVCEQLKMLVLDTLHSNDMVDFQKGNQVV